MISYDEAIATFDADREFDKLAMNGSGAVNAAEICCDRHADDPKKVALRHRGVDGTTVDWTFAELKRRSSQFACVLAALGVTKGARVAGLLPRRPELLITILAAWRLGAVYQPLFTAFGPKAIEYRVEHGGTAVVVTDRPNRSKLTGLPATTHIVTVAAEAGASDTDFWSALEGQRTDILPIECGADDPFLLMFTSGTTGPAKALEVPIRAIAAFARYLTDAVGLRAEDSFWNLADPGWAYGLYYAVTGPLALGIRTIFHEAPFTVASTYQTIRDYAVTCLAGSPTAFRLMIAEGVEEATRLQGRLRTVSSAGEPLNPEIIRWFQQYLSAPIRDHYGQTELGMVLCNHHGLDHPLRLGSAGYASPGHRVVVLSADGVELGTGEPGTLALDRHNSPMMWFKGYLEQATPALTERYYLSGDTVELNADGTISFIGRADDVITTSGYRVGPFDVESVLLEHDAVLESAVIGKPDADRTEIIKAFVVVKSGYEADEALVRSLQQLVRMRLSAHAYPREVEFVASLPKTPSGKVQRSLLRAQERTRADR